MDIDIDIDIDVFIFINQLIAKQYLVLVIVMGIMFED